MELDYKKLRDKALAGRKLLKAEEDYLIAQNENPKLPIEERRSIQVALTKIDKENLRQMDPTPLPKAEKKPAASKKAAVPEVAVGDKITAGRLKDKVVNKVNKDYVLVEIKGNPDRKVKKTSITKVVKGK